MALDELIVASELRSALVFRLLAAFRQEVIAEPALQSSAQRFPAQALINFCL